MIWIKSWVGQKKSLRWLTQEAAKKGDHLTVIVPTNNGMGWHGEDPVPSCHISGCLEDRPRVLGPHHAPLAQNPQEIESSTRHVVMLAMDGHGIPIPILGDVGLGRDPKRHAARQWVGQSWVKKM